MRTGDLVARKFGYWGWLWHDAEQTIPAHSLNDNDVCLFLCTKTVEASHPRQIAGVEMCNMSLVLTDRGRLLWIREDNVDVV